VIPSQGTREPGASRRHPRDESERDSERWVTNSDDDKIYVHFTPAGACRSLDPAAVETLLCFGVLAA
jgi:hypothetical protein